ncbi:MAG: hypothetical protein WBG95_03350, partial [Sulfitobacter sp.]
SDEQTVAGCNEGTCVCDLDECFDQGNIHTPSMTKTLLKINSYTFFYCQIGRYIRLNEVGLQLP